MVQVQIIRSPNGDEMVVLPRNEYEALVAAANGEDDEDAADVAMYDARKAELAGCQHPFMPEGVTQRMLSGDSRLRAVRLWREMTQAELARAAGIGQGYLSGIEAGKKAGTTETLSRLAAELNVPADWIG